MLSTDVIAHDISDQFGAISDTLRLDIYDKASVIYNDMDKLIEYLLSQKNQRIVVTGAAFRFPRIVFNKIRDNFPDRFCISNGMDKCYVRDEDCNLEIIFTPLCVDQLRGVLADQIVLVNPRSMGRETLESFMFTDIILYTGELN